MTTTLYQIADVREALDAAIAEAEGELTPAFEAALDAIDEDFESKAEKVGLYIRERLAMAEAIKGEEERLAAKRTALTNTGKRLTEYLFEQMKRVGKQRVNGLLCQLVIAKNPASVVEITPCDQEDLRNMAMIAPTLVKRTPETFAWDKNAVKAAQKEGTLPPDVARRLRVVTDNTRLDIK